MKTYDVEIKINWIHTCQAESEIDAIEQTREFVEENHELELSDAEIISVTERPLEKETDDNTDLQITWKLEVEGFNELSGRHKELAIRIISERIETFHEFNGNFSIVKDKE